MQDIKLAITRYERLARMMADIERKRREVRNSLRDLDVGDYGCVRVVWVKTCKVKAHERFGHKRVVRVER